MPPKPATAAIQAPAVAGFGGMRDHAGKLTFGPRLPGRLARLRFRLLYRGRRLSVEITKDEATYTILEGDPLELAHHGEAITVSPDAPTTRSIPPPPDRPTPSQPAGRAPRRRAVAPT